VGGKELALMLVLHKLLVLLLLLRSEWL